MLCFTLLSLSLHLLFYLPLSSLLTPPYPHPRSPPLCGPPCCPVWLAEKFIHWQLNLLWPLANELSLEWLIFLFCSFLSKSYLCCISLVLLVVPAFWLLCNEFHTGRPLYTPGVVSHFVLLPRTPSVTVLLGAVCCCMSSQLIDAKNLFNYGIFPMFFVMSLVCFKPDTPEAQHET